mmetsp:Transcript_13609/g.49474  ORF Transcript_13609/g.49474 Transcript_13609/m.49474 type:complete len:388 (-) Transcript_13609:131-1294(-)
MVEGGRPRGRGSVGGLDLLAAHEVLVRVGDGAQQLRVDVEGTDDVHQRVVGHRLAHAQQLGALARVLLLSQSGEAVLKLHHGVEDLLPGVAHDHLVEHAHDHLHLLLQVHVEAVLLLQRFALEVLADALRQRVLDRVEGLLLYLLAVLADAEYIHHRVVLRGELRLLHVQFKAGEHLRDVGHQVGAVAGEDGDHGGGLAGHVVQTDARGALDLQRLRDGQLLVVLAVVAVDGRGGGRRRIGAAVAVGCLRGRRHALRLAAGGGAARQGRCASLLRARGVAAARSLRGDRRNRPAAAGAPPPSPQQWAAPRAAARCPRERRPPRRRRLRRGAGAPNVCSRGGGDLHLLLLCKGAAATANEATDANGTRGAGSSPGPSAPLRLADSPGG